MIFKKTYKIHGAHCASCVGKIERALLKTTGVISASFNFATESALIEFDENVISEKDIAKTIDSIGYHLDIDEERSDGRKNQTTQISNDEKAELISLKV